MSSLLSKACGVAGRHARRIGFQIGERLAGLPEPKRGLADYARASLSWLLRAQAATADDGVAANYNILTGNWDPSYPETTGYIVCSLLRAAHAGIGDAAELRTAATRMGHWLLTTQLECGAFPGGNIGIREKVPTVFNTGQILKGLTDLMADGLDRDGRLAQSAKRAADWLRQTQDMDGAWYLGRSPLTQGRVHSYDVRTAWALARYGSRTGDSAALEAGIRNAEWLCLQRGQNGWFGHMSFQPGQPPLTHTVAYTIQGLLETGVLAERPEFVESAAHAAAQMLALQNPRTGSVPGQIVEPYAAAAEWTTGTGNAQMAIIWFRLAQIEPGRPWKEAALKANRFNLSVQELDMESRDPGRRGALRGSYPGHLGYGKFWYMNWTQKFHLDALLAQTGVSIV